MTDVDEDTNTEEGLWSLFAKLSLSIDTLADKVNKANLLEQKRYSSLPVNMPFSQMSNPGAATTDIKDFDGPKPGREWIVRLLSAMASPIAANAAVVTWYVGQNMPGPATGQLPSTMAVWQFPSVPGFQTFTSDIIKVRAGERLLAGLTTVPASSFIALKVIVNDQPSFGQSLPVAVE
jgi:hypothetical protein